MKHRRQNTDQSLLKKGLAVPLVYHYEHESSRATGQHKQRNSKLRSVRPVALGISPS